MEDTQMADRDRLEAVDSARVAEQHTNALIWIVVHAPQPNGLIVRSAGDHRLASFEHLFHTVHPARVADECARALATRRVPHAECAIVRGAHEQLHARNKHERRDARRVVDQRAQALACARAPHSDRVVVGGAGELAGRREENELVDEARVTAQCSYALVVVQLPDANCVVQ